MTTTSNVVPAQPQRYTVMRRVKARRFALATVSCGFGLVVSVLFDYNALMMRQSGFVFWLALALVGVMSACALAAVFYLLKEQPSKVEVLEDRFSDAHVVHLTPRQ